MQWCEEHKNGDDKTKYTSGAFYNVEPRMLFSILNVRPFAAVSQLVETCRLFQAANYLGVTQLEDEVCEFLAKLIKRSTAHQIRTTFDIKLDFTPEEQKLINDQNSWLDMSV